MQTKKVLETTKCPSTLFAAEPENIVSSIVQSRTTDLKAIILHQVYMLDTFLLNHICTCSFIRSVQG